MNRRWIHYKMSSSLMIIGIAISFVCFFNCMSLYHLLAMQKKEAKQYRYKSQKQCSYLNMQEKVSLGEFLYADIGILRAQDIILYRSEEGTMGLTDVILNQQELLAYPVIEGKIPQTDSDINVPTVILGRKQMNYAVQENGQWYYEIEDVKCRVCAVIGTKQSDVFDYKILLYYKGLPEELCNRIDALGTFSCVIESNKTGVDSILQEIQNRLLEKKYKILISVESGMIENEIPGVEQDGKYYLVILLFCVANIIIVSEYWIKSRYQEIAIRKVFGYSDIQIYGLLYGDIVKIVCISVSIALVFQLFIGSIWKDYIQLYLNQIGYYIGVCVLFIILFSAVILIYPVMIIQKQEIMKQMIARCR